MSSERKQHIDTVDLLGIKVSRLDLDETIQYLSRQIEEDKKCRVSVTSVSGLIHARKQPELKKVLNSADLVTADGVPMLWAARLLGRPIRGRVTGFDLLPEFAKVAAERGYSFYFLGAGEGVADRLASRLSDRYSGLQIAGTFTPPYADRFSEEENARMIRKINAASPDVLWVSLSAPKQDYWIYEHFEQLDINIALGVGAAFDVHAGLKSRAPHWMQQAGLEWFYRLCSEPRRLARRYLWENPRFIPLILKQYLKSPPSEGEGPTKSGQGED